MTCKRSREGGKAGHPAALPTTRRAQPLPHLSGSGSQRRSLSKENGSFVPWNTHSHAKTRGKTLRGYRSAMRTSCREVFAKLEAADMVGIVQLLLCLSLCLHWHIQEPSPLPFSLLGGKNLSSCLHKSPLLTTVHSCCLCTPQSPRDLAWKIPS